MLAADRLGNLRFRVGETLAKVLRDLLQHLCAVEYTCHPHPIASAQHLNWLACCGRCERIPPTSNQQVH